MPRLQQKPKLTKYKSFTSSTSVSSHRHSSSVNVQKASRLHRQTTKLLEESKSGNKQGQSITIEGPKLYNKLEKNAELSNKKNLFLNMKAHYEESSRDPFEVLPLTFLIRDGVRDVYYK